MSSLEPLPAADNPLGVSGVEFIEYATAQPQALGSLLTRDAFLVLEPGQVVSQGPAARGERSSRSSGDSSHQHSTAPRSARRRQRITQSG